MKKEGISKKVIIGIILIIFIITAIIIIAKITNKDEANTVKNEILNENKNNTNMPEPDSSTETEKR